MSCPASDLFGAAGRFNVYLAGAKSSTKRDMTYLLDMVNGDVEGSVAVNGGFKASAFGVGSNLPCQSTQPRRFNLIANGPLDFSNGQVFCGSGITLNNVAAPTFSQPGSGLRIAADSASLQSIAELDFAATTALVTDVQSRFCATQSKPVESLDSTQLRAQAATGDTHYFSVTTAQLNKAVWMAIDVPSDSRLVVINVVGGGPLTITNFGIESEVSQYKIVWNVCGSTKAIRIGASHFDGSLLAIGSDITLNNAQVNGNILATSLTGTGSGEVHLPRCPTAPSGIS